MKMKGRDSFPCCAGMFAARRVGRQAAAVGARRDRLGQKPLIYRFDQDGRRLLFASELKALLALPAATFPHGSTPWPSTAI